MICRGCQVDKELDSFPARNDRSGRLRPYCYLCVRIISKARYHNHKELSPFKHKVTRARARSNSLRLAFDLTEDYLQSIWTGVCPVLNVSICINGDRNDEFVAELDRFIPEKGYVKGNVHFLSRRANRLKNNVTTKELQQLIDWMKQHENQ